MIPRRLVLPLLIATLVVPASSALAACCSPQLEGAPRVSAACGCHAADCAMQPDPRDNTPSSLEAHLTAPRQRASGFRAVTAVRTASAQALIRLARVADLPPECHTASTLSCHGVSLPLRL